MRVCTTRMEIAPQFDVEPEFVRQVELAVNGILRRYSPTAFALIKIDNWFGRKWPWYAELERGEPWRITKTREIKPDDLSRLMEEGSRFAHRRTDSLTNCPTYAANSHAGPKKQPASL